MHWERTVLIWQCSSQFRKILSPLRTVKRFCVIVYHRGGSPLSLPFRLPEPKGSSITTVSSCSDVPARKFMLLQCYTGNRYKLIGSATGIRGFTVPYKVFLLFPHLPRQHPWERRRIRIRKTMFMQNHPGKPISWRVVDTLHDFDFFFLDSSANILPHSCIILSLNSKLFLSKCWFITRF